LSFVLLFFHLLFDGVNNASDTLAIGFAPPYYIGLHIYAAFDYAFAIPRLYLLIIYFDITARCR